MNGERRLKWALILGALIGILLICVLLYTVVAKPLPVFLTTASPEKIYSVSLKGQKTQPLFFTAKVRFGVLKNGAPFVSDRLLHSADSEDLPFQFRYPNTRWINEHCLQFFHEEYL